MPGLRSQYYLAAMSRFMSGSGWYKHKHMRIPLTIISSCMPFMIICRRKAPLGREDPALVWRDIFPIISMSGTVFQEIHSGSLPGAYNRYWSFILDQWLPSLVVESLKRRSLHETKPWGHNSIGKRYFTRSCRSFGFRINASHLNYLPGLCRGNFYRTSYQSFQLEACCSAGRNAWQDFSETIPAYCNRNTGSLRKNTAFRKFQVHFGNSWGWDPQTFDCPYCSIRGSHSFCPDLFLYALECRDPNRGWFFYRAGFFLLGYSFFIWKIVDI